MIELASSTPHLLFPRLLLLWLEMCQVLLLIIDHRNAVVLRINYCILERYHIWQILREEPLPSINLLSWWYLLCVFMRVHIRYAAAFLVIGPFGRQGVSLLYHEIPRHSCPRLLLLLLVLGFKRCKVILVVAFTYYWIYIVLRYYWCWFLYKTAFTIIYGSF